MRGQKECVLAHVELHSRMQRQHHQFARRIARESDAARAVRNADDERHAGERALDATLQRHYRHRSLIVFPQQHVMLKEYCVSLPEIDFCYRHDLPFDLTGAQSEMNFSHVSDARRFTPAGFADEVGNVQRRAARPTRERRLLVHSLTPFTSDALDRIGGRGRGSNPRSFLLNGSV